MIGQFTKTDLQITLKYVKKGLVLFAIREMQIDLILYLLIGKNINLTTHVVAEADKTGIVI